MRNILKRKKKENPTLDKKNLKPFLAEITKAIDQNFSGQESNQLQKLMKQEFRNWVKNTIDKGQPLDIVSVKVGICLGILESLRKINEAEEKEKIGYIA